MSTATANRPSTKDSVGRVTQVIGSTFDVAFPEDKLVLMYYV